MSKYKRKPAFFDTEEEANKFCNEVYDKNSKYIKKKYGAYYMPWRSQDGKEQKYIVWYVQQQ